MQCMEKSSYEKNAAIVEHKEKKYETQVENYKDFKFTVNTQSMSVFNEICDYIIKIIFFNHIQFK